MGGWINDPDPEGNPWGFVAYYPGARTQSPYPGGYNMGYNAVTRRAYSDIWIGWDWISAKTGPLPADPGQFAGSLPDRNTIFGTHAVGIGSQRGWYLSAGSGGSLASSYTDPKKMFTISAGTFMKNGGATRTVSQLDLSPNPNHFASGTAGDVTTWVSKVDPMQPNGDQKTLNTFDQSPYEGGSGYANGFGKWTTGYNFAHDFMGDLYTGIGPVKVPKDSSVTFVLALVGGYRLEGIQRAVRAARYVSQNGSGSVPALPAVPDVRVTMTFAKTAVVEWDSVAESSVGFAGYKVWRSSTADKKKWLEDGTRLSDRYQEQMVPGTDRTAYKKPVNPKFDAFSEVMSTSSKGEYQSDSWGTWELLSVIPRAQLTGFPRACTPGYRYRYEDATLILDQRYWYYVSAYADGLFTGPGGETTDRVETHCVNRNGASGLWLGTYPFAFANANFPRTREGLKQIGAGILVKSTVAYPAISFGSVNLGDSRDIAVVLRNSADSLLELVSVASDPEFTFTHTACSIAPGDSLRTTIRFTPTRLGQVTGCCYFLRNGSIIQDSLLVAGSGIAGKLAPQVTWECRDDTMRSPLGGPGVSIDAAGSVYSAYVPGQLSMEAQETYCLRRHSVERHRFSLLLWISVRSRRQRAGEYLPRHAGLNERGGTAMAPTVAKVSPGGVLLWVKSLSPPYGRSMECAKLALDNAGNAYVLGSSYARATGYNSE